MYLPLLCVNIVCKLWMTASGASAAMKSNPGYYASLLSSFVDYPNPSFAQIELVPSLLYSLW